MHRKWLYEHRYTRWCLETTCLGTTNLTWRQGSPTSIIQTAKQTRGKPHTYDTSTYKKPIISSNSEELSNQNRNQGERKRETWRRHDDELVGFRDRSIVNLHGDATACSRYPTLSVEVTAELSHQRARLLHLFTLQIRLRKTDRRRHWLPERGTVND